MEGPVGPPAQKRARTRVKRKQPQHSADIAFISKGGGAVQTLPSLSKQLKDITDPIVGLQFIWEYRSPSKSVPPHYQCKLCQVTRLQTDMVAHVKGWKHGFRYLKRNHPLKVPYEEEAAGKDPAVRKEVWELKAEVEKKEGRGQLRVIMKEPKDVAAFEGQRSAIPRVPAAGGPALPGMGVRGPQPGGRFPDVPFPGEYPAQGGRISDYPMAMGGPGDLRGVGGYSDPLFAGADMGSRRYPDEGVSRSDGFGRAGRREAFGMGGLLGEAPGRRYSDEFRGGPTGSGPVDGPGLMGAAPESSNLPSTLLKYLDSFRIESENDAQIVLKVTQKLTDVLMEYRLRSVSSGSGQKVSSMGYASPPAPPSRMQSGGDRYSSSFSGQSRYNDGPSRFFN